MTKQGYNRLCDYNSWLNDESINLFVTYLQEQSYKKKILLLNSWASNIAIQPLSTIIIPFFIKGVSIKFRIPFCS